jgi:hypothetical protein
MSNAQQEYDRARAAHDASAAPEVTHLIACVMTLKLEALIKQRQVALKGRRIDMVSVAWCSLELAADAAKCRRQAS